MFQTIPGKMIRDGLSRPLLITYPHKLILRRITGWRRSTITASGRRTARAAARTSTHPLLRRFLPLLKLIRSQNFFHFRRRGVPNFRHFRPAILLGQILVLEQFAHFLALLVEYTLDLRFLVVGQVQFFCHLLRVGTSHAPTAASHAPRWRATGRRTACGRSVGGSLRAERRTQRE